MWSHPSGTVVFPGTHHKVEALARSNPDRYRFTVQIAEDLDRIELGEPVELTPRAGDVCFLDSLLVHCKAMNTGSRPRFAMNLKW